MKRLPIHFSIFLGLVCLCSPVWAGPGNDKVQTEMVADTSAIVPGKPFMAGFKFKIEPGWHIYWKNPGDSGLATEIKLKLPDGFTSGDLMFPVPAQLTLPGDLINYAYQGQVMLMVRITPPKDLPVGKSIALAATASWLVCKDECVPGRADVSLELPVAEAASSDNADLFKEWIAKLPAPEKNDSDDIITSSHSVSIANGEGDLSITIDWKNEPKDVQFIPGPVGDIKDIKIATDANVTKINFVIKGYKSIDPYSGLVLFTSAAGLKKGVDVSIAPPGVTPAAGAN